MRVLRAIVQPSMDTRQYLPLGSPVSCKLICEDYVRHVGAAFQKLAEEFPGCGLVSSALHKDIEHGALLVKRSPEIVLLAVDLENHFIQVPLVSRLGTSTAKLSGILLAELERPATNNFIPEDDAASRHQLLNVAKTQGKPEVQPICMGQNLAGSR